MKKEGVKMVLEAASAIKLEEAYFCLNCELVTNCLDICPVCGHRELWSLEKWLGRVNGCKGSMDKEGTLRGIRLAHEMCM